MKTNLFLFALVALLSCHPSEKKQDYSITEERNLEGVTKLRISGVFNLYLTQSDQESLSMYGSSELADKLKITQQGDELILEMEEFNAGIFDSKDLQVNLSIANLEEFEFEGVGNIQTTETFTVDSVWVRGDGVGNLDLEFQAKEMTVDLNMVGKMSLKGNADRVFLKNEGIGNLDASELVVQDMDLQSSGIGKVDVNCTGQLSLQVDGIGKVSYSGNPKLIKKEINGIGKVEAH
jgi:hypothetical protein